MPGLFFAGMYNYAQLMTLAVYQADFIRSVLSGRAKLPTYAEMEEEVQNNFTQHLASGQPPKTLHLLEYKTAKYVAELGKVGGLKPYSKAIIGMNVRVLDLIFKNREYITMRESTILERLDEDNFIERKVEKEIVQL